LYKARDLTFASLSIKDFGSTQPATVKVPGWRLQRDVEGSVVVQEPHATGKLAPRFLWGDFEALSYTWGEENADGRVVVNGTLYHVHRNLEAALRRLRALPETEYGMKYWIDALCINQKNIPERNAEVKRMREIYKRAWSIVVWLGEGSEDRDKACDCISGMGHLHSGVYTQIFVDEFGDLYGNLKWKPLMDLLGEPYWKRVWIIQELAMNHQNTLFIYGERAVFRKELEITLDYCMNDNLLIQKWLDAESDDSADEDQENLYRFFRRILSLLELDGHRTNGLPVDNVLILAQEASSKDMRDKVYGILGLLPNTLSSRIQPNYDLCVVEIVQDFSQNLLRECGLESILSWGGSDLGLPSWCVDLLGPLSRSHIRSLRQRRANLNQRFPYTYRFSDSTNYLLCNGVFIDTIESATECSLEMSDLNRNTSVQEDFDDSQGDYPMVEDEALIGTLIETLVLAHPDWSGHETSVFAAPWVENRRENDISDDFNVAPHEQKARELFWKFVKLEGYFGAFDEFRKANSTFKVRGHELKYFFPRWMPRIDVTPEIYEERSDIWYWAGYGIAKDVRLAVVSLVGRALANTTNGHLALIPSKARKGDVIAIVDCPFPIILRPKGQGYEYIGECYLQGFMDGEAFAGDKQPKVEEIMIV
jgi:hypothetical protein